MGEPTAAEVTALKTTSRTGLADDNFFASADAQNVAISGANEGRIRYNNLVKCWQRSVNGGPWECFIAGDSSQAGMYMSVSAATPLPLANTPAKILGTTTAKYLVDFTHTSNRLTYTGTATRNFTVIVSLSMVSNTNAHLTKYYVAKNGAVIADSEQREYLAVGADAEVISIKTQVSLATGDYIEIWVETTTANPALTVTAEKMWVVIISLSGSSGAAATQSIRNAMGDITGPGCTSSSATWDIKRRFRYPGTNSCGIQTFFRSVSQRNSGAGTGQLRIYDETNGNQIAIITGIAAAVPTIYSGAVTVAVLPALPAIFSFQMQRVGGAASITAFDYALE